MAIRILRKTFQNVKWIYRVYQYNCTRHVPPQLVHLETNYIFTPDDGVNLKEKQANKCRAASDLHHKRRAQPNRARVH